MAYGLSNGYVTDDVTWPPKLLWGSTVGYPSDSLASCPTITDSTQLCRVQRPFRSCVSSAASRIPEQCSWTHTASCQRISE